MAHAILNVLLVSLLSSGSESAAADGPTVPLSGTVVDSTGAALAGATVTLALDGRPSERATTTDPLGRFGFDGVPPGTRARLTATFERFAAASLEVAVEAEAEGLRSDLRLVLAPMPFSDRVTVTAHGLVVERVSSATKTDTPLRDVPQAVSVVTREAIDDLKLQGIADVVRYLPGVGIAQGEGNRDTPILRGNASTSDFYVDGVKDDVQYIRDLYNVERVEALKGPNGMIFGRGGAGGVINRVTRQAEPGAPASRELSLQLGSWDDRRAGADLGGALGARAGARVTGVYERSGSYRERSGLERYGINPTVAVALGSGTTLRAGYEHFHDERTADRGIPSYQGRPLAASVSSFFGNPDVSESRVTTNVGTALVEHRASARFTLRNRTSYGEYDKHYQNVFPGAVNAAGSEVAILGYSNATRRQNLFNQTDLVLARRALGFDHTLLVGAELGRQVTDNIRNTAYFTSIGPATTTLSLPVAHPTTALPVEFRPSASDASNHGVATVAALYVQDQVAFSKRLEAVLGLRYDRFTMDLANRRTGTALASRDDLVSPRLGLVFKPVVPVSVYASYALSHLPRAGEQLGSLTPTNQALDPETFRNYELGAKWDLARGLALTVAAYRLDRSNVIVPDPADPTRSVLVDGQRTKGVELGAGGSITPAWSVLGGYAFQDGTITRSLSATARAGATLAQLPRHSFSLWSRYEISRRIGAGIGVIHRSEVFTSLDNTVALPAFTRVDAAVFVALGSKLRAQLNVENLFDVDYFAYAHSNNNITPGSPRALRVGVTSRF